MSWFVFEVLTEIFLFLFGKPLRSFSQIGNKKISKTQDLKAFSDEL